MSFLKNLFGSKKKENDSENKLDNATMNNASALKFDGLKALRMGNLKFAELALKQAMDINPDYETRYYYAQVLFRTKQTAEALLLMDELVEETPNNIVMLTDRATFRLKEERYADALDDIQKAIEIAEDDDSKAQLYALQTQAFMGLHNYIATIEAADKMLAISNNSLVFHFKILALCEIGKHDEAIQCIAKAKEQYPEDEIFLIDEAHIYSLQGNKEEAEEKLLGVLELDPFNNAAILALAQIYSEQQKNSKAIAVLQEFIENSNANNNVKHRLIELYNSEGMPEKAKAITETLNPDEQQEGESADFSQIYAGGIF